MDSWYNVENLDVLRTPCLLVYPDRIAENIDRLIAGVKDVAQLRPHVKTHKSVNVTKMLLARGIRQFKCATLKEAIMLAKAGAPDILLAYPLIGPAIPAWLDLIVAFPDSRFACLVDGPEGVDELDTSAAKQGRRLNVYLDLNVGMNRTGVRISDSVDLAELIRKKGNLKLVGLHAYDGHLLGKSFQERKAECDAIVQQISELKTTLEKDGCPELGVVMGGSCSFPFYSADCRIQCSPGTFVYWDRGYEVNLPEQTFAPAAILLSRVISKPSDTTICIDLGYKAVASENPLDKRFYFLSDENLKPLSHSEEHLVVDIKSSDRQWRVGDELYVLPYHICPTVAMYDEVKVIADQHYTENWPVEARGR